MSCIAHAFWTMQARQVVCLHPARDAAAAASAFALTFCFVHACTLMSPMGARGGGLSTCHLLCASVHMYDFFSVGGPWPYC